MFPNKTRILVIDDMAAMRLRVINQLKSIGFVNIDQAENGQEGFDLLEKRRNEKDEVNLVISDLNMPIMTGIELLEKVRTSAIYSKLPYVMITAEGEKEQVIRALKLGVSDYLVKPVEKSLLVQKLAALWTKQPKGKE